MSARIYVTQIAVVFGNPTLLALEPAIINNFGTTITVDVLSDGYTCGMKFFAQLKERARSLQRDTLAVWFAAKDNRTPWYARALAILVTAYALSPVDLVPDFIPILGYLDDLILIPAGIALTLKLIPPGVMAEARVKAEASLARPATWWMTALIILVWIGLLALIFFLILPLFQKSK